jgi:hypothetical protein
MAPVLEMPLLPGDTREPRVLSRPERKPSALGSAPTGRAAECSSSAALRLELAALALALALACAAWAAAARVPGSAERGL